MPEYSVDDLARLFPDVDPATLETINDRLDDPHLSDFAAVLDSAAEQGKVPEKDYFAHVSQFLVEEEELEAEGFDPANVARGLQADRQASGGGWAERAQAAAGSGDAQRIVDLHNKLDQLANEAMYSPDRSSLPSSINQATQTTAQALDSMIEDAGVSGDRGRLEEIAQAVTGLQQDALRTSLTQKITDTKRMMENSGADFEEAKDYVLDEENTPTQVQRRTRELYGSEWDLTIEQVREIAELANEWMDEYEELAQQAADGPE